MNKMRVSFLCLALNWQITFSTTSFFFFSLSAHPLRACDLSLSFAFELLLFSCFDIFLRLGCSRMAVDAKRRTSFGELTCTSISFLNGTVLYSVKTTCFLMSPCAFETFEFNFDSTCFVRRPACATTSVETNNEVYSRQ